MRDKTRCFRSGLSRSHSEIKKQRLRAISLRRVGYFIAILNFILALMEHRSRAREVLLDIKNLLAHAHNWLPESRDCVEIAFNSRRVNWLNKHLYLTAKMMIKKTYYSLRLYNYY